MKKTTGAATDEQNAAKTDDISRGKSVTMRPRMRKFMLTAHITFSVGWLGAVLAYIALAITGLLSPDIRMVKVVYPALELIGRYVVVPSSLVALLTGLIQALGTNWGLFNYYWILVEFLLTFIASIVLINHLPVVSKMSNMVTGGKLAGPDFEMLRVQLLVHASGGLLILIFITVLSVYKPWGRAIYGLRNKCLQELPGYELNTRKSWGLKLMFGVLGLVMLFIVLHLLSGGMRGHH